MNERISDAAPDQFVECPECAGKPGSPTLCNVCLHNRGALGVLGDRITVLQEQLSKAYSKIALIQGILEI